MDSLIIGFSRPKAFFEPFSWVIRLVTMAPMSHAYIRYYDSYTQRSIIFQASGLKVNLIGQTAFDAAEDVIAEFEIPISAETKQKIVQGAIDKLGSPYGMMQVFGVLWVLLMRLFGKTVANPLYSATSFFCSELTDDELEEIGMGDLDPAGATPKDLYNFLIAKGLKPIS